MRSHWGKRTGGWVGVLAMGMFLASVVGAAKAPRDHVLELMDAGGLAETVDQVPAMLAQQLASFLPEAPGSKPQGFAAVLLSTLDVKRFREAVIEALLRDYDAKRVQWAIDWERAPTSRKINRASLALGTPQGAEEFQRYVEDFARVPPSPTRVELAKRLDRATRGSEQMTDITIAIARAMVNGLAQAMGESAPAAGEEEAAMASMREQMLPLMEHQSIATHLFITRGVSVEELEIYAQQAESPEARWYVAASMRGLTGAFEDWSVRMGLAMVKWFEELKQDASMAAVAGEGTLTGTGKADRECVAPAFARDAQCKSFECHLKASLFLDSCLAASSRTADLCRETPSRGDFEATLLWRAGSCAEMGRQDHFCQQMLAPIQKHCERTADVGA